MTDGSPPAPPATHPLTSTSSVCGTRVSVFCWEHVSRCKALALASRLVPAGSRLLGQKLGKNVLDAPALLAQRVMGRKPCLCTHLTWGSEVSVSFLCPKMPAGPCEHHKCLCSAPPQSGKSRPRQGQGWTGTVASHGTAKPGRGAIWNNRKNGYVSRGAADNPVQPQPSAQQSLLLPSGTQQPQSWDTLKVPRGNSSITTTGPQGRAADVLLSQDLGPHFWRCSARHLLPPVLHLSQYKVTDPLPVMLPGPASQPRQEWSSRARPITWGTRLHKPLPKYKRHRGKECPVAFGLHIHCFKLFICICNSSTYSNMPSRNHMANFHFLIFQQR